MVASQTSSIATQDMYLYIAIFVIILLVAVIGLLTSKLLDMKQKKTPKMVQVGGHVFKNEWVMVNPEKKFNTQDDQEEWEIK